MIFLCFQAALLVEVLREGETGNASISQQQQEHLGNSAKEKAKERKKRVLGNVSHEGDAPPPVWECPVVF